MTEANRDRIIGMRRHEYRIRTQATYTQQPSLLSRRHPFISGLREVWDDSQLPKSGYWIGEKYNCAPNLEREGAPGHCDLLRRQKHKEMIVDQISLAGFIDSELARVYAALMES